MGTPFGSPVVGGAGNLLIPAIQSPNFSLSAQTGWAIMQNGDAYFFDITAEGSISSNTVVVSGAGEGIFIYSGVPASGNLIGSWTGAAGTDSFGNAYPDGLTVGAVTDAAQVQLLRSATAGAAEIAFPIAAPSLSNIPNVGAGKVSTNLAELVISGPGLAASGVEDWVQISMYSNDDAGDEANGGFRYISSAGGVTITATFNGSGWTFYAPVNITDGITVNYMTSPNGNPVFGWSEDGSYPLNSGVATDTNSGTTWASGERAFMNNNWVAAINANAALTNYMYQVLQDAGIIAGG